MNENKTLIVSELKHLFPKVYDEYMKEQRIQGNNPDDSVKVTRPVHVGGMSWEQSKLGYKFWSHINKGRLQKAKDIAPHLFMSDEKFKDYSIQSKKFKLLSDAIGFNEKLVKDLMLGRKYQNRLSEKLARKLSVELIKKNNEDKEAANKLKVELQKY